MKKLILSSKLGIFLISIFLHSCKNEELPSLTTSPISNITASTSSSGGIITSDGGAIVTSKGVCWNKVSNPTISNSKTNDGGGTGQFISTMTDLDAGTTYHVRAYATNSVGTAYGANLTFSTLGGEPECITQSATNITANGTTLNGTVNANYASTNVIFEYGTTTVYGQTVTAIQSPITGSSMTNVSASITGLNEGTTYHFRVKALNSLGTAEGNDMTFTTSGQAPTVLTQSATNINVSSATFNGIVNANYALTVVTFEYGLTKEYGSYITAIPSPVTGNTPTVVSADVSDLSSGTTYHFRIKGVNSISTVYGEDMTVKTSGQLPKVTTLAAFSIQTTTATLNGTVNANELTSVCLFEYGLTSSYDLTASPIPNQITGSENIKVSVIVTGLSLGTTYHYRLAATNKLGTSYGEDVTFTTIGIPVLSTNAITGITNNSAISGGNITSDGGSVITARGVCWSMNTNPTTSENHSIDGKGNGSFVSSIIGLSISTTYYVRAYAMNNVGTAYGEQRSFTTKTGSIVFNPNLTYGTLSDIDGNNYRSIKIGDQEWMAENLKTSRYNDGNPIPNVTSNSEWNSLVIPLESSYEAIGAFSWYNNDASVYDQDYGKLYNFGAVESKKLCPTGWHVPTTTEWGILCHPYSSSNPLDPTDVAGNELIETGSNHWTSGIGTNETGFTALPGGLRGSNGFNAIGSKGYYWSSNNAWGYGTSAYFYPIPLGGGFGQTPSSTFLAMIDGLSVRCMKDKLLSSVTTLEATKVTYNAALSGGIIPDEGGAGANVINRGVCWSTYPNPTTSDDHTSDGSGPYAFYSHLQGLSQNTTYYLRAYAINTLGTIIYGNQISFTTHTIEPIVFNPGLIYGAVTDIDGNTYKTIQIGSQTWMAENLKTTKFNDNTPLTNITDNLEWAKLSSGAYCWYFNDPGMFKTVYGALYNWYATTNGKLCPTGWHVPTDLEWHTLVLTLDGTAQIILGTESYNAGGKLKELNTRHWESPNTGATNESGFTAIPGGLRVSSGEFYQSNIDREAHYWSTTELVSTNAYARMIFNSTSIINRVSGSKVVGMSVRCLKD